MRRGRQIASLVYPFDTFSMYASVPERRISHLMMRDARGEVYRVNAFRSFDCREPMRGEGAACADRRGFEYHYDDLVRYIEEHRGGGSVEVELIARSWEIPASGAPELQPDCVVAHCTVAR